MINAMIEKSFSVSPDLRTHRSSESGARKTFVASIAMEMRRMFLVCSF